MAKALKPKTALAVAAHPDDLEFGVAGTAAHWARQGTDVYYLLCTDGSKGSADRNTSSAQLIKTRRAEQLKAAKILGVKDVFFLDYEDGLLELSRELKVDIARVIRQTQPEVVMTMDPTFVYSAQHGFINHNDHRVVGQATLDAVFPLARDHLSFPELLAEGLEPHKVRTILLNNFHNLNHHVDISDTIDLKLEALNAHQSQIPDSQETEQFVRKMAQQAGQAAGFDYAEGFIRIDLED